MKKRIDEARGCGERAAVPLTSAQRRAGMTMIELVSALSLMAIVVVTVLALLNKASTFWSGEAHNEIQEGEVDRFFRQLDDDLRQASAGGAGDVSSNVTFCAGWKQDEAGEKPNYFLCFVRPVSSRGYTRATGDGGETWRLSLDCVKYAARESSGEIIREVYPLVSDETVGKQVKRIWEDKSEPSPDAASTRVALRRVLIDGFGPTLLSTNEIDEILVTNELPVSVTLKLRAFKDDAEMNAYRKLRADASEEAQTERESLGTPYTRQFLFPAYGSDSIL